MWGKPHVGRPLCAPQSFSARLRPMLLRGLSKESLKVWAFLLLVAASDPLRWLCSLLQRGLKALDLEP